MKLNVVLVVLLLAAGSALAYVYYDNSRRVDSDDYISTLAAINELKRADAELNTLMLKSRYGLQDDYDDLANHSVGLNKTFDALKASAIGRYYANDNDLESLVDEYEEMLNIKNDLVENFKSHNAVLRNSIKYAPGLGEQLIRTLEAQGSDRVEVLKNLNQALYRWALYTSDEQAEIIQANANEVLALMPLFEDQVPLIEYNTHILTVVDEQAQTQQYLQHALDMGTEAMLEKLQSSYTGQYFKRVQQGGKLRYYAVLYGILCLLMALYFIWQLRRSYARLEDKVDERTREINTAYEQLKDSQEQLVQSEKMASLGQMVSGIAHEINTPLAYVNNNVSTVNKLFSNMDRLMQGLGRVYDAAVKRPGNKKTLAADLLEVLRRYRLIDREELVVEAKELLNDSAHGLNNISALVGDLRDFARLDRQDMALFDVREGVNTALKIATSILREHQVALVKEFDDIPLIKCTASKLNQAFLNIITNAAQAMGTSGGTLTIKITSAGDQIVIVFADTGTGMNEQTKAKIFDPFFTTKPVGKGTGLGLSISYTIIKEHNGSIDVVSTENEGTVFTLKLPREA
ncbi:MAG: hypothetical protein KTR20_10375 [Cellvibrionaceae bacterium]|nr:hypothetical protein [Cellvibrionaceae bacterium]